MTALDPAARTALRDCGISVAAWARAQGFTDGRWHGDACGCPDDRCAGYHHDDDADCGCFAVLLEQYLAGLPLPSLPVTRDDLAAAFPEWDICQASGIWTARLTTSQDRPQPYLTASSAAELAERLNGYLTGGGR